MTLKLQLLNTIYKNSVCFCINIVIKLIAQQRIEHLFREVFKFTFGQRQRIQ